MTTTSPCVISLREDLLDGLLLRLADDGRALEGPDGLVDAGRLHDAAVDGEVAAQDREAAVLGVGVLDVADAAARGVRVQGLPALGLGEGLGGADAAGGRVPQLDGLGGRGAAADVPGLQPVGEGRAVDGVHVLVEQARRGAARRGGRGCRRRGARPPCSTCRPGDVRGDLGQARHPARDLVDVGQAEVDARPPGRRPAGAGSCWWSRPWRCRGPWRSRRRRGWRCCAAGRSRRPARSSAG